MAFDQESFAPIGGQSTSAPSVYSYRTQDVIADVSNVDYFGEKVNQLEEGDQIYSYCSDGSYILSYSGEGSASFVIAPLDPSQIMIERILDGESVAVSQEPTGTGVANAIPIEFGPAINDSSDPVNLLADGSLQINKTGTYRIKVSLQFGRVGGAGTSELLFRVLVNGAQAGRSVHASVQNSNVTQYIENDSWVFFPAGTVLVFEVMRDDQGNNSGGLYSFDPTVEPGSWNFSPSASVRVERWSG